MNDTPRSKKRDKMNESQRLRQPQTPELMDSDKSRIRMDSPRLCRAMRAEGVEPDSLMVRHPQSFLKDGKTKIMPEIADRRHKAYDAIRLENTAMVLEARQREIEKAERKARAQDSGRYGKNRGKEGLGIGVSEAKRLMEEAQKQAERILVIASQTIEAEKEVRKQFEEHVQEVYRAAIQDQLAAEAKEAKIAKDMEKTRYEMELQRQEREERAAGEEARLVTAARDFDAKKEQKDKDLEQAQAVRKEEIRAKRMAFNQAQIIRARKLMGARQEEEQDRQKLDNRRAKKLKEAERARDTAASERHAKRVAAADAEKSAADARKKELREAEVLRRELLKEEWEVSVKDAAVRVERHEKAKKAELARLATEDYARREEARKAKAEAAATIAAEKLKANADKFAAAAIRAEGIAAEQAKQQMIRVEESKLRHHKKEAHVARMIRKQESAVSNLEQNLEEKLRRADASNLEKKMMDEARAEASKRFFVERRKMLDEQEAELERLRFGASYYPGPDGPDAKPKLTPKQQALVVARLAQTDRAQKFAPHPPLKPRDGGGGKEDEGRAAEGAGVQEDREREDGGHAPEYHELLGMMARAKQWMLTDLGGAGERQAPDTSGPHASEKRKKHQQWNGRKPLEFVRHNKARQDAESEDKVLLREQKRDRNRGGGLPGIRAHRQPATVR